jgi:transcriptional regulator with XRE-family HTH domain
VPFCRQTPLTLKALRAKDYFENPQTLGQHLKKRRRQLGLLQREAADRMGVSADTVVNWESDKTKPMTAQFRPVATFLGYDPTPEPQTPSPTAERQNSEPLAPASPRLLGCACRKLHPAVLMMKSAENRPRCDLTVPMDRPMGRRILVQRQMRPEFVVVAGVGRKDPAQMGFAEDNDVIEAFPTDRADQSLRMPILPRRPWGRRVISDAHGRKPPGDRVAVGRVAVAD